MFLEAVFAWPIPDFISQSHLTSDVTKFPR